MNKNVLLRFYYLVIFTFCFTMSFFAQEKSSNIKSYVNVQYGVNADAEPVSGIINNNTQSLEFGLVKETIGDNEWESYYDYPEYGVSFLLTTLGNKDVLGKQVSVVPFFKTYLLSLEKIKLYGRLGMGFGYITNKYDSITNPMNEAISTHFNFHTNIRLGLNYKLNNRHVLNSGVSFDHVSNGNFGKPNLGLNRVSVFVGMDCYLKPPVEKKSYQIKEFKRYNDVRMFISIGGKKSNHVLKQFYTLSSTLEYNRFLTKGLAFGFGTDLFWDDSVKSDLRALGRDYQKSDSFQHGIFISENFRYNRLKIGLQQGVYTFLSEKIKGYNFYTKTDIQYNLHKNLVTRLSLKAHNFHILDYPELGIGYKFL